ncbi:MAG TPA: SMP-30/gluconolactonase/LRE family protein [Bryobacteraceae bacterium]|jgi:gluconolactonase|nr:SMP-30/gluconolactonase/LRE family protein [Bryobacteraceae bacterium]
MKSTGMFTIGVLAATAAWCQIQPPAGLRSGPGVQASQDSREPDVLKACKTPPPARGGRGGGGRGPAPATAPGPKEYTVTEIPGVVAAGQQWKEVWQVDGNNADGIIATKDGGLLIAQNDKSAVVKLDKDGKASEAYTGTNTGGSVATNAKGALFVANRGLNPSIEQLAPTRKTLANRYNDDPMDCIGVVLNDISADSKGGLYFTMGGVFYADSKGKVTRYGENLNTNGIVLSADEKHLYVTNGATLAAFDVQKDGSLTNQREFAKLEGGGFGDGSTFDTAGRLYVTTNAGVQVIGPDGKYLGLIPTPRGIISVAFSGPDRKTLYAVSRDNTQNKDWIIAIPMMAQGPKGRGK